jgi:hypothetical protein
MDFNSLYNKLLDDFNLRELPNEDQEELLFEVAKTIQKQFLLSVYDALGDEKFQALQASAQMGEQFYATTLKHLLPHYEELFQEAITKVTKKFKEDNQ